MHSLRQVLSIENRLISDQQNEDVSELQEVGHINNTVVLIFWYFQCVHLMYSEVAWVLVSSRTKVQSKIILEPDELPDYLSVSYDYKTMKICLI